MVVKLNDTFRGRPEQNLPANVGMAKIANEALDRVVSVANRKYAEALKVDGYPIRIYMKNLRGSIPCTCSYHLNTSARTNAGDKNAFVTSGPDGAVAVVKKDFDLRNNTGGESDGVDTFMVRGAGTNRHPGHFVNQPLETSDEQAPGTATFDPGIGNNEPYPEGINESLSDEAFKDLSALSNIITGGDRKSCGICFGGGFVDGLLFLSGKRIILDNNPTQKIDLMGARSDTQTPNRFSFARKDNYVVWDVSIPSYFDTVPGIKIMNDRKRVDGLSLDVSLDGVTWVPFTTAWLMSRKGQNNRCKIRIHPTVTLTEGAWEFTHVEFLLQTQALPYAQFPQFLQSTNYEEIGYTGTFACEVDPSVPPITRETIFENTVTGDVFKVVDTTNRKTAKGQGFGFELTVRLVQQQEQVFSIRYSHKQLPENYRGVETTQENETLRNGVLK